MYVKKALESKEGESVEIKGWVYRERELGEKKFVVVRDRDGIIQCVLEGPLAEKAKDLKIESSVRIKGTVHEDSRAPGGKEIHATEFELIGSAERFPITKDQSVEFLLDVRHLWLRSRKLTEMMKIKDAMFRGAFDYFEKIGWTFVTPPIIVGAPCEGGSTLFQLDYFGKPAYLSQSAQLYLESAIYSLEQVFSLTPSFRAEKSRTRRHLAEYWHLEGEAAWIGLKELMDVEESLVVAMVDKVLDEAQDSLKQVGRDPKQLESISPFERITYTEAVELLQSKGVDVEWGDDLGTEQERVLTMQFDRPLFVTHYPKEIKAFYMKPDPKDPRVVLATDLLAPEGYGEIIGGSVRDTDVKSMRERLIAAGDDPESLEWYFELRKFGDVPHAGFGLGMERVLRWISGVDHIRDTIMYPRVINRVYP